MFAQFRYLDGTRLGEAKVVGNDFATIGRHPTSDLGFDPETLEVSVRHAAVFKQGGGFLIRDLGSTNGTFVNDQRVRGDRPLEPNDVIRLGPSGPRVEFTTTPTMPIGSKARAVTPVAPPVPSTEIYRPRARTTAQFPVAPTAVGPGRSRRPWTIGALLLVVVTAATAVVIRTRQARGVLEQQRATLVARVDDQLARLAGATTSIPAIGTALGGHRNEATSIRAAILSESATHASLDSLDRAMSDLVRKAEPLVRAAGFDPAAATQRGAGAVAVIIGEVRGGETQSGTGVVVRVAGDSVWIAAPGALVMDGGRPSSRIAVIFRGAKVAHLATVAGAADSSGLTLVKAVGRIGAPPPASLGEAVSAGDPVAAIGFPAGADSLGDWRKTGALGTTTTTGTILGASATTIEVEGYGAMAPLGSLLYTASGEVVGLVVKTGVGRWAAVPAGAIRRLVDQARGSDQ